MEEELGCDFYFGNISDGEIKKMEPHLFRDKVTNLNTKKIFVIFNWISGSTQLSFKEKYSKYILTGDPFCLSNWILLLTNKLQGKKTYLWTHGWYGHENLPKKIIKKTYFKLSSGLFLYGDYAKQIMIKEGISENKLHVIYNSLDYDDQVKIRYGLKEDDTCDKHFEKKLPIILFTGRLTETKQLDILIMAHKKLIDSGVYANVVIVGDGPSRESLEKLIENLGIKNYYYFHGECYEESLIGKFFYNATICVSPGNVGLTSIHAMTYGCPVISHSNLHKQMPEFEVIEQGLTGDFFEYNNIDSLAKTIQSWLEDYYPKPKHITQACFNIIDEKFNPNYQISIFKQVLLN